MLYSTDNTRRLSTSISSHLQQQPHKFPFVNGQYMYSQPSQMVSQDPYYYMNSQFAQPTVSVLI